MSAENQYLRNKRVFTLGPSFPTQEGKYPAIIQTHRVPMTDVRRINKRYHKFKCWTFDFRSRGTPSFNAENTNDAARYGAKPTAIIESASPRATRDSFSLYLAESRDLTFAHRRSWIGGNAERINRFV